MIGLISAIDHKLLRIPSNRETTDCSERQTIGYICQTCSLVAICIQKNGIWEAIPVDKCDETNGFYCNLAEYGCSNKTGPCHPALQDIFTCSSDGVFPNPYDCQKYYTCSRTGNNLIANTHDCGRNRAFSIVTRDCSLTMNHESCKRPQFNCTRPGDSGAWPGEPRLFYVCIREEIDNLHSITPYLHWCDYDEIYMDGNCVPVKQINGNTGNPTTGVIERFKCPGAGLYQDLTDCRSYYICDTQFYSRKATCQRNYYFNDIKKSCLPGHCTD